MSARPPESDSLQAAILGKLLEVLAEQRLLRAELRALAEIVAPAPTLSESDASLAHAIAATVGGRAFTVKDLLEYAEGAPALRAAILDAVGGFKARRLGKKLASLEGVSFGDFRLVRLRDERAGVLRVCEFETRR